MTINRPVLVLNASYEPIQICSVRRAMKLLIKGVAKQERSTDRIVWRGARGVHYAPSVVRLIEFRKVPRRKYTVTRKGILVRDRYTCQYCGKKKAPAELTLDHVQPKSRAGENTWENLVASCYPCNNRKDNRTPEEAGMPLLNEPRGTTIFTSRNLIKEMGKDDSQWNEYLYVN